MLGTLVAHQARHGDGRPGQSAPGCELATVWRNARSCESQGEAQAGLWTFLEAASFRKAHDGKVVVGVLLQLYKVGPAGHVDQFLR